MKPKPRIWLCPQVLATWAGLPSRTRERAKQVLYLLASGTEQGVALAGMLSSFLLYRDQLGLEVLYRFAADRLEVLTVYWAGVPDVLEVNAGRVVGLILAAGRGEYEGRPLPLAKLQGQPLITRMTHTLLVAGANEVIVVLGYQAESIKAEADLENSEVVVNPH